MYVTFPHLKCFVVVNKTHVVCLCLLPGNVTEKVECRSEPLELPQTQSVCFLLSKATQLSSAGDVDTELRTVQERSSGTEAAGRKEQKFHSSGILDSGVQRVIFNSNEKTNQASEHLTRVCSRNLFVDCLK